MKKSRASSHSLILQRFHNYQFISTFYFLVSILTPCPSSPKLSPEKFLPPKSMKTICVSHS